MKHWNRLITKLYPRAWRNRYGEEFQALLEEVPPGWRPLFNVIWSGLATQVRVWNKGRILTAMAIVGGVAGFSASMAIPKQYASGATIQVFPVPSQLLPNDQSASKSVTEVAQRAWSSPRLAHIVEAFDLYEYERAKAPLGDAVEVMRKAILVRPIGPKQGAKQTFVVQFTYPVRPWRNGSHRNSWGALWMWLWTRMEHSLCSVRRIYLTVQLALANGG